MTQVNRRALILLLVLALIIGMVIHFLPVLQSYSMQKKNNEVSTTSSQNSTSTSSPILSDITIKTRYNQECTLSQKQPSQLMFNETNTRQTWFITTQCLATLALRVVQSANFQDAYARKVYSLAAGITFLVYTEHAEDAELIDPLRYQTLLAKDLINPAILFDPTKAFKTFTTNIEQYFLLGICDESHPCALWKQSRITGISEMLMNFTPPSPRFASDQTLPTLLLLKPATATTTEVISIDTQNPSNVFRRTFYNSDPILEKYNQTNSAL